MSDTEKTKLAENIYSKYFRENYPGRDIEEKYVKDAYEFIFGIDSYKQ